jgi:hypothetical protein
LQKTITSVALTAPVPQTTDQQPFDPFREARVAQWQRERLPDGSADASAACSSLPSAAAQQASQRRRHTIFDKPSAAYVPDQYATHDARAQQAKYDMPSAPSAECSAQPLAATDSGSSEFVGSGVGHTEMRMTAYDVPRPYRIEEPADWREVLKKNAHDKYTGFYERPGGAPRIDAGPAMARQPLAAEPLQTVAEDDGPPQAGDFDWTIGLTSVPEEGGLPSAGFAGGDVRNVQPDLGATTDTPPTAMCQDDGDYHYYKYGGDVNNVPPDEQCATTTYTPPTAMCQDGGDVGNVQPDLSATTTYTDPFAAMCQNTPPPPPPTTQPPSTGWEALPPPPPPPPPTTPPTGAASSQHSAADRPAFVPDYSPQAGYVSPSTGKLLLASGDWRALNIDGARPVVPDYKIEQARAAKGRHSSAMSTSSMDSERTACSGGTEAGKAPSTQSACGRFDAKVQAYEAHEATVNADSCAAADSSEPKKIPFSSAYYETLRGASAAASSQDSAAAATANSGWWGARSQPWAADDPNEGDYLPEVVPRTRTGEEIPRTGVCAGLTPVAAVYIYEDPVTGHRVNEDGHRVDRRCQDSRRRGCKGANSSRKWKGEYDPVFFQTAQRVARERRAADFEAATRVAEREYAEAEAARTAQAEAARTAQTEDPLRPFWGEDTNWNYDQSGW